MSNENIHLVTNRHVQDVATDLTIAYIQKYAYLRKKLQKYINYSIKLQLKLLIVNINSY